MSLRLDGITFAYRREGPQILTDLTLDVPGGHCLGLTAPSGSGKSTLLRLAALLLTPSAGSVTVCGERVTAAGYRVDPRLRRRQGLVLQSPRSATNPRLTLRHLIAEPLSAAAGRRRIHPNQHRVRVAELAERVQLTDDLLDRLPHQVSDGQLQRACLARALALGPRVLLCDEPTAMLDAPTTAVIMHILAEEARTGSAVLVASHDEPLLSAVCDDVVAIRSIQRACI